MMFTACAERSPNLDAMKMEEIERELTKIIMLVHYAECGCDMNSLMDNARRYRRRVVKDAEQMVDSWHARKNGQQRTQGRTENSRCVSFLGTKNAIVNLGGMLPMNNSTLARWAEIISAYSRKHSDCPETLPKKEIG